MTTAREKRLEQALHRARAWMDSLTRTPLFPELEAIDAALQPSEDEGEIPWDTETVAYNQQRNFCAACNGLGERFMSRFDGDDNTPPRKCYDCRGTGRAGGGK